MTAKKCITLSDKVMIVKEIDKGLKKQYVAKKFEFRQALFRKLLEIGSQSWKINRTLARHETKIGLTSTEI